MRAAAVVAVAILGALAQPRSPGFAADAPTRVYELRIYTAAPGKLDAINARFRDHTCKLFEKHGMTNVGYWTPAESSDARLVYMLAHDSREAADRSWKEFLGDPEWTKVVQQSEANGKIVAGIERRFLTATDYWPSVKAPASGGHVYELRTYTTERGRLDPLNARFRDHTIKLFEKHGMTNVGFWVPIKDQKGAGNTLIYLLAHRDMEAAKQSWAAFRQDPEWTKAKVASEAKAGGPLTVPDGVKSLYLTPTDYSPTK
jgi:hypothetical protein